MTSSPTALRTSRIPRFITVPTRGVLNVVWGTTIIVAGVIQIVGVLAFAGAEKLADADRAAGSQADGTQQTGHTAEVVSISRGTQPF